MNPESPINSNLTILLLTFNEIDRIEYLLSRYTKYCEVILLDNNSVDGTLEIAKKYNVKVLPRLKPGLPTIDDLKHGSQNTSNEWIHIGACSEILPRNLLHTITNITSEKNTKYEAFAITRVGYTWGGKSHVYRSGNIKNARGKVEDAFRFIKKSSVHWQSSKIHYELPSILSEDEVYQLPEFEDLEIPYFREGEPLKIEIKHSQYADLEAKTNIEKGKKFSWIRLLFGPPKHFVVMFAKRPTLIGFICAIQHSQLVANIHLRMLIHAKFGKNPNAKTEALRNQMLRSNM